MKLCLSTDALPGSSWEELAYAVRRRAFDGLEWGCSRPIHSVGESSETPQSGQSVAVRWVMMPAAASSDGVRIAFAERVGAGLVIRDPSGPVPFGGRVALLHGSDPEEAAAAAAWAKRNDAYTAWDVDVQTLDGSLVDTILDYAGERLVHLLLHRAEPDTDGHPEVTGALFTRLALMGYGSTIAIVPVLGADPALWRRRLLEDRRWGCQAAHAKKSRVERPAP